MFKRNQPPKTNEPVIRSFERINSILGPGLIWEGKIGGTGGVRIEGTFEGQIELNGMLIIGESGKVTCETVKAMHVIVAGSVKGDILTSKLEIRSTGRVYGNVTTTAFITEEGAFLRGQMKMEEQVELGLMTEEKPE